MRRLSNPHRPYKSFGSEENRKKSRQFADETKNKLLEMAKKYFLDDLSGAQIPASMVSRIIEQLDKDTPLSVPQLSYLKKENLIALYKYSTTLITKEVFDLDALQEQKTRQENFEQQKAKQKAIEDEHQKILEAEEVKRDLERKARDKEEAARRRLLEQDPKYIAQKRSKALLEKYGVDGSVKKDHLDHLLGILNKLEAGQRLVEDEVWLKSIGKDYFKEKLKYKFHAIEAEFYIKAFDSTKNIWNALSASSHLRKSGSSQRADQLLDSIKKIDQEKNSKLRSAFHTTYGGVKRDLEQFTLAISYAKKAHQLTPDGFQPCTLLGAIYMETHEYLLGHDWYEKAVKNGYKVDDVDTDLMKILRKLDKSKQRDMSVELLKIDKDRYQFLKSFSL